MSDLNAAARRIGEAAGHIVFISGAPACERDGAYDGCQGCRAERAALVELTAAVEAEREACHELVRLALYENSWHRSIGYCLGKIMFAIRARSAKIAEASHTPSSPRGGELCDPHTPRGLGVKEEPA